MRPQYPVAVTIHHKLGQHALITAGNGIPHGAKQGAVNFHMREFFCRRLFRKADSANFRVRKHSCRDQIMIGSRGFTGKCCFQKTHGFMNSNRRQLNTVSHITDCPDMVNIGLHIRINNHRAGSIHRNTGFVQTKTGGIGLAAHSKQNLIRRHLLAIR